MPVSFKPVVVVNYDVRRDLPAEVELTCHAWLGASTRDKSMDRLAVGMTSGEILVLSSRAVEVGTGGRGFAWGVFGLGRACVGEMGDGD